MKKTVMVICSDKDSIDELLEPYSFDNFKKPEIQECGSVRRRYYRSDERFQKAVSDRYKQSPFDGYSGWDEKGNFWASDSPNIMWTSWTHKEMQDVIGFNGSNCVHLDDFGDINWDVLDYILNCTSGGVEDYIPPTPTNFLDRLHRFRGASPDTVIYVIEWDIPDMFLA